MSDKSIMVEMYLEGESLPAIGRAFGCSRQYIHQVVQRAGVHRPDVRDLKHRSIMDAIHQAADAIKLSREIGFYWTEIISDVMPDDVAPSTKTLHLADWLACNPDIGSLEPRTGPEIICRKCMAIKERDLFSNDAKGRGGKNSYCKACFIKYRNDNPEIFKKNRQDYYARKRLAKNG